MVYTIYAIAMKFWKREHNTGTSKPIHSGKKFLIHKLLSLMLIVAEMYIQRKIYCQTPTGLNFLIKFPTGFRLDISSALFAHVQPKIYEYYYSVTIEWEALI